ncbi:MAG TPA: DUF3631 domain-containing protein, partial [Candidatus Binatia bacterium]|nr:DUF3631 domain-containing protein [Candidatus Binatia bacterium]
MNLKLFNAPHVIRSTRRLLLEFFGRFTHLLPYKHAIPNPALDCDLFPQALPRFLEHRREGIPECMYQAMADVEASAFEKRPRFEAAQHQDPDLAAFTEAIEHWLRQNPSLLPPLPPVKNPEPTQATALTPQPATAETGEPSTFNLQPSTPQNSSLPPVKNPEPTQATAPVPPPPIENQNPKIENSASGLPLPKGEGRGEGEAHVQTSAPAPQPAISDNGKPATFNLQPSTSGTPPLPPVKNPEPAQATAPAPTPPIENQNSKFKNPSALYILNTLVLTLNRFAILPKWAAEAIALFIFHTYAWELRDITAYLGIESPRHRCGKTTLLGIIRRLVNRPEVAAHISSPAMYRTIHAGKVTLITDEFDKAIRKNHLLGGILNASNNRDFAYVVRVVLRSHKQNGKPGRPQVQYVPLDVLYEQNGTPSAAPLSAGNGDAQIENQKSKIENSSAVAPIPHSALCTPHSGSLPLPKGEGRGEGEAHTQATAPQPFQQGIENQNSKIENPLTDSLPLPKGEGRGEGEAHTQNTAPAPQPAISDNGKPATFNLQPSTSGTPPLPPVKNPGSAHAPSPAPEPDVARFSCWCPKAMAQIGHFPETLADRCIIVPMQRKTPAEKCQRLRNFKDADAAELHRQCALFVEQHRDQIANAEPAIPEGLNDRAGDVWEPLFVLADL